MVEYDNRLKNLICFVSITKTHKLYKKDIDKDYIIEKFQMYIGIPSEYDVIFDFVLSVKDDVILDSLIYHFEFYFGKKTIHNINKIHNTKSSGLHPVLYNSLNFEKIFMLSKKRKIYSILNG